MSKKSLVSIDCQIPGGLTDFLDFESKSSLLDWDIILFYPSMVDFKFSYESYKGKPSLDEKRSFRLKEAIDHWKRELADAYGAGKTIVTFLPELLEVYVDTGEREYSGTGRNQKTTRIVSLVNNYQTLPIDLEVVASEGKAMKLTEKGSILADYWREFEQYTEFKTRISGKMGSPTILTKTGGKTVGSILRSDNSKGLFLLLPYLDMWTNTWDEEAVANEGNDDDEEEVEIELDWTDYGVAFGNKLLNCLLEIDSVSRASSSFTPAPSWLEDVKFKLPKSVSAMQKLLKIESKLEDLENIKEDLKNKFAILESPKKLLYEKGKPLERAILDALTVLGYEANGYEDAESEFDVVFVSNEGRFLGEVEGRDNKAVGVGKLRQLEMNILEDYERDEVASVAKGVLFGNAFRLKEIETRDAFFTQKCITAAKRAGTALVRAPDLFPLVQYLTRKKDSRFAKKCRQAILSTSGELVVFPGVPNLKQKTNIKDVEHAT